MYSLDADWTIQALAGRATAVAVLNRAALQRITISAVTIGEVYEGAYGSSNPRARLDRFQLLFSRCTILDVTEPIMARFTELRSGLRRRGQMISDFDMIIGATALHYDLTVLTFNVRHLGRIPDIRIYTPRA